MSPSVASRSFVAYLLALLALLAPGTAAAGPDLPSEPFPRVSNPDDAEDDRPGLGETGSSFVPPGLTVEREEWAAPQKRHVLPPEAADRIQSMALPFRLEAPVREGWVWSGLSLDRYAARLVLSGPSASAEIHLGHRDEEATGPGERLTGGELVLLVHSPDPTGQAAARELAERLVAAAQADGESLWRTSFEVAGAPTSEPEVNPIGVVRVLQVLWLLVLALLAWHAADWLRARRGEEGSALARQVAPVAVLLLVSALPRILLATFGPGDLQPKLVTALTESGANPRYGSAPLALLQMVLTVAPRHFDTLIATNLVFGSLAPLVLAAFVRVAAAPRDSAEETRTTDLLAYLAGGLLALQPLTVRHSGEAGHQAFLLFLGLLATWALARYLRDGGLRRLLLFAAAAVLTFQTRPEAALLFPLWGLLVPAVCGWPGLLRRWPPTRAMAAVGVFALLAALWVASLRLGLMQSLQAGTGESSSRWLPALADVPRFSILLDASYTSVVALALAGLGLLAGLLQRRRFALWTLLALLFLVAYVSRFPIRPLQLYSARYQAISLVPFAIAAAWGLVAVHALARRLLGRGAALACLVAALAGVAATSWTPFRAVSTPRTVDLEMALLRDAVPALPEGTTVYVVPHRDDIGIKQPYTFVPHVLAVNQDWKPWDRAGQPPPPGAVYYHPPSCWAAYPRDEYRRLCEDALRRYGDHPVFERTLPALPIAQDRYVADELRVGFYSMTGTAEARVPQGPAPALP